MHPSSLRRSSPLTQDPERPATRLYYFEHYIAEAGLYRVARAAVLRTVANKQVYQDITAELLDLFPDATVEVLAPEAVFPGTDLYVVPVRRARLPVPRRAVPPARRGGHAGRASPRDARAAVSRELARGRGGPAQHLWRARLRRRCRRSPSALLLREAAAPSAAPPPRLTAAGANRPRRRGHAGDDERPPSALRARVRRGRLAHGLPLARQPPAVRREDLPAEPAALLAPARGPREPSRAAAGARVRLRTSSSSAAPTGT